MIRGEAFVAFVFVMGRPFEGLFCSVSANKSTEETGDPRNWFSNFSFGGIGDRPNLGVAAEVRLIGCRTFFLIAPVRHTQENSNVQLTIQNHTNSQPSKPSKLHTSPM